MPETEQTIKSTSPYIPREYKTLEDNTNLSKYRCSHCQETFYCDAYPVEYCPACGERKPKETSSDWTARLERSIEVKKK